MNAMQLLVHRSHVAFFAQRSCFWRGDCNMAAPAVLHSLLWLQTVLHSPHRFRVERPARSGCLSHACAHTTQMITIMIMTLMTMMMMVHDLAAGPALASDSAAQPSSLSGGAAQPTSLPNGTERHTNATGCQTSGIGTSGLRSAWREEIFSRRCKAGQLPHSQLAWICIYKMSHSPIYTTTSASANRICRAASGLRLND